jgi:hypothetical protein
VTVISGKDRRITFFECPNDLNAMVVRWSLGFPIYNRFLFNMFAST